MELELELELDVIEHEPTVLEYARFHGLCSDFTQELQHCYHGIFLSEEAFDQDLRDPDDAAIPTDCADELTKERLAVSKEAAMLLSSVRALAEAPQDSLLEPNEWRTTALLKLEVPLLRTDNELDLLAFGHVVEPGFTDLELPLEPIDEERDEGLRWPSSCLAFPEQWDSRTKSEKFGVPLKTLVCIQDVARSPYSPSDYGTIKEEALHHRKNAAAQPVTPPLLPATPPLTPYIPSSPGTHLEIISDDSNFTTLEAKAIEEDLMAADSLVRHDSDGSDTMLLDMLELSKYESNEQPAASPCAKRKASDLRIEGPLTPPMFSESPSKKIKTVAFAEALIEYIPNGLLQQDNQDDSEPVARLLPEDDADATFTDENGNNTFCSDDDYAFLKDAIEPAAEVVKWRVENEKLSEADTTRRMPTPQVEFRLPIAPWNEFTHKDSFETELEAQSRFLLWVKRNHMKSATSWHGSSELERTLPVSPFHRDAAKVSIEEQLHGEDVLVKMFADLFVGVVATSATDIWKKDGLRLVEEDESDEDLLEPDYLGQNRSMDSLVRVRHLEMQEATSDHRNIPTVKPSAQNFGIENMRITDNPNASHHWSHRSSGQVRSGSPQTVQISHKDNHAKSIRRKPSQGQEVDNGLMFGGGFFASNALDKFMTLHGMAAKQNANDSSSKRPSNSPIPSPTRPAKQMRSNANHTSRADEHQAMNAVQRPRDLLPLPEAMPPCSFIISSSLLQRRRISRQIESLYPDAEVVSRDFDSQLCVSTEADLILSPSTGVILTTLQQLKQRALPGQSERSPVKDRMLALQDMYERLIVLASEGLSREMEEQGYDHCSDQRDQGVTAEYRKIAENMKGEVIFRYVAGGEDALARSIVTEMAQYGLPHGSKDIGDIKLLPDQTTWELFLRRAGLNAFAAQVILALLKDPTDWPQESRDGSKVTTSPTQTCGLQTFLFMSAEHRIQSFQTLLGGCRVLTKVNALLDESWLSAAHGFRL